MSRIAKNSIKINNDINCKFENGIFSAKGKLGEMDLKINSAYTVNINNETQLMSMSMNKSVTSYILGHAICDGYIGGVDTKINDWPILSNTLYENQKLIDLLNMSAGDQKYINDSNIWKIFKKCIAEKLRMEHENQ